MTKHPLLRKYLL
ncbi:hypothetical protein P38_0266 [Pseudomonas aeruginosa MH38]|nr:hypothetical protein P38_0266 [Pseudomonas aeruginosa MH38]